MSAPLVMIARETFTSDGVFQIINMPGNVEQIMVRDITNVNTPANNEFVEASWTIGMNNGTAIVRSYTGAQPATSVSVVSTDGIGQADTSTQTPGAIFPTTAIPAANPAVVSAATTAPLIAGDVVRLINQTGALEISSVEFTVDTIVAGVSFNLSFLDGSLLAAPAAAGFYRRIVNPPLYSPRQFTITNIGSVGTISRFTLSVTSDVAVGEELAFVLPADWGMVEMDGLRGTVTAIGNADTSGYTNTIDVDIDSSGFTAFAFPLSAASPFTFPQAIRFGNVSNLFLGATDNIGAFQIQLGSAVVGDLADIIEVTMLSGTSI